MKLKLSEVVAKYGDVAIDEAKFKEVFGIKIMKGQKPKTGETYWVIHSTGAVQKEWDDTHYDRARWDMGNAYDTQEDAQFELNRIRFITLLKRYIQDAETSPVVWDGKKENYCFVNFENGIFVWGHSAPSAGTIYAAKRETLDSFLKQFHGATKLFLFGEK